MTIRRLIFGLVIFTYAGILDAAESGAGPEGVGARLVAKLQSSELMMSGVEDLHYAEAAAAVGALRFAGKTGNDSMRDELIARYADVLNDESDLINRRSHVASSVTGIVPLQIAIMTGDPAYLELGVSFADRQGIAPLENGPIDHLYVIGMLQIQAYRATGDPKYADRAARQLVAYLPVLQQGNGWAAVALAEVLSTLPHNHRLYGRLSWQYLRLMKSLLEFQGDDGMWRQVIDHDPAWPETSATAMFAYAMELGIQSDLLSREHYGASVDEAWSALVARDLDGQAPMLWLAAVLIR